MADTTFESLQRPFDTDALDFVRRSLSTPGISGVDYEAIVYGPDPAELYGIAWHPEQQERAQQGLTIFKNTVCELTGRIPQDRMGFIDTVRDWRNIPRLRNLPDIGLSYQGYEGGLQPDDKPRSFLHARPTNPRSSSLDPAFDEAVRVYANPGAETVAVVAAGILNRVCVSQGAPPYLKFFESSAARSYSVRRDKLVVYTYNPDELTAVLSALTTIQNRFGPLSGRPAVSMGQSITHDGVLLPSVKIAQSPRDHDETPNQRFAGAVQKIKYHFGNTFPPLRDIETYYRETVAPELDMHPNNSAFNAGQDLGVIARAINAIVIDKA